MWNDTDVPLGFLITFRCYRTWLHGDEGGSTNRFRNKYGTDHLPPEPNRLKTNTKRLKETPLKLNTRQRKLVESAIRETCKKRGWDLLAINVRTNHVHSVVAGCDRKPSIILNAFKSNATRTLRESGLWVSDRSPWADKGSERWLWMEKHIDDAMDYVLYGQGDLPEFR